MQLIYASKGAFSRENAMCLISKKLRARKYILALSCNINLVFLMSYKAILQI